MTKGEMLWIIVKTKSSPNLIDYEKDKLKPFLKVQSGFLLN